MLKRVKSAHNKTMRTLKGSNQSGFALLIAALAILVVITLSGAYFFASNSTRMSGALKFLVSSSERNALKNASQKWAAALESSLNGGGSAASAPYSCSTSGGPAATDTNDATITHSCRQLDSGSSDPLKMLFAITTSRGNERATTLLRFTGATAVAGPCVPTATSPKAYGSGTSSSDPYLICTAKQLDSIRSRYGNKFYKLTADIHLETLPETAGTNFHPISGGWWRGGIDGGGYTIYNMHINGGGAGLVSVAGAGAYFRNIHLVGVKLINSGQAGAIAGLWLEHGGEITNCTSSGDITSSEAGGLIGSSINSGIVITGSSSSANITASDNGGGLLGKGLNTVVDKSYFTGTVTYSGSSVESLGGLLGSVSGGSAITNSYSTGKIDAGTSLTTGAGGLIGERINGHPTVDQSYAAGQIIAPSASTVAGGLVGASTGSGSLTVTNSYWDKTTTGRNTSPGGGTGMITTDMQDKTKFAGWDFSSVWSIQPGGYPTLQ